MVRPLFLLTPCSCKEQACYFLGTRHSRDFFAGYAPSGFLPERCCSSNSYM